MAALATFLSLPVEPHETASEVGACRHLDALTAAAHDKNQENRDDGAVEIVERKFGLTANAALSYTHWQGVVRWNAHDP